MKRLLFIAFLLMTTINATSQEKETKGRAIGKVVTKTETSTVVRSDYVSIIIQNENDLEEDVEYDMVYKIVAKRPGVIIVELIKAEHSAVENLKRRLALNEYLRSSK